MVSVVSGSGLGVLNSSRVTVGAGGELGQASQGRSGERVTVNAANGNLVIQNQDGQVVGVGADINLLRTYNSRGGWDGDNGDAWRLGYYRRITGLTGTLNAAGSTLVRTEADGFESTYTYSAGRYLSTDGAGAYDSLVVAGATATWTDGDTGLTETYTESTPGTWRLTQITDPDGHAVRVAYDAQGLIASLSTWKAGAASADETLTLIYDASKRLTQIRSITRRADGTQATQTRTTYTYDSANRLSGVVTDLSPEDNSTADGRIYSVAYTYDSAGRVRTITQTDRSALTIAYDSSGRVSQLTDALGRVTTFAYDTAARQTTVTDALNQSTRLSYDSAGRLSQLSGTGFITSLAYDADGNVLSSSNGLGQQTQFAYDSQGNLIRSTDATGSVLERSYDAANRQTSQTQAAQTTRYVYDTTGGLRRLRFTISAEGRVSEQQYNSLGQLSSSLSHTLSPYTGAATLADLASWVTQASQQTAPQRADYGYDLRGQLASRTDANGLTRYTHDAFGRLLQSIDASGNTTAYAYDGLDRLTLSTDALGVVTTHEYSGSRTDVQLVSQDGQTPGLRTISTYNAAGLLITLAQFSGSTPLGETRYTYDAANRLRMTQDPTGQRQWLLYDEAGRQVGSIDALGHLTETRYDAAGRAVQSIGYEQPVNTALLTDAQGNPANVSLAAIRPGTSANDRREWQIHDAAGRLTHQITSLGEVTETRYDAAGRVSTVIQHGQRLSALPANDTSSGSNDLPVLAYAAGDPDRITRKLHDADGLLRGTLDAEGYLTEMRYDAAGRLVERIAYATATDAAQRSTGMLGQLTPAAHGSDRRSVWLYDAQGRVQGEIDPDGFLTETAYNAAGQRTLSLRFARRITAGATPTSTLASLRPVSTTEDQATRWTYDALARVKTETAADGTLSRYTYDKVGNLISTERAVGTAEVRSHNARHDSQGRLTAELSAEGATQLASAITQEQIDAVWASYATRHVYDAAGRRIRSTDARGSTTVFYYDAAGRQVYRILKGEQGGEVQASRYTGFGETASTTRHTRRLSPADTAALTGGQADATLDAKIAALADGSDQRTQASYNQRGLIQQAIDALGHRTDYQYNAFGQLSRSDAAAGSLGDGRVLRTDLAYDRRGLLASTTQDPLALKLQTRTAYDAFGRAVASVDARGNRNSTEYRLADGSPDGGRQVIVTDAAGASRSTTYDAFDHVVKQTDSLGRSITFSHDTANRRVTMTTAMGIQTVTESNRHGQVVRITDGTGATTTHAYDANGRLQTSTDALGQVTTRTHDQAGNLITLRTPGNTGLTRYEYDTANRLLIQTVDPDGLRLRTTYDYDGQGRVVRVTDADGSFTSHVFNARGELQEVTRDDRAGGLQLKTLTTHDAQGRTLSVTEGASTPAAKTTEYRYDLLGRRTHEIVDPAGLQLTTRYEFDAAGNVVFKRDALGGVTRYAYDEAGRQTLSVDAVGAVTQTQYDAAGRIAQTTQYATPLPAGTALQVWRRAGTNSSARRHLGDFKAGDVVTASVRFKTSANTGARLFLGDAGGPDPYDNMVYSPVTYGNDTWQTLTVSVTLKHDDMLAVYVYGDRDGAFADDSHSVLYDDVVVSSVQRGQVLQEDFRNAASLASWVSSGAMQPVATGPAEADSDAALGKRVKALADPARDQVTRSVHDADGRRIGVIDAAGGVTETRYDEAGRVLQTTRYATLWPAGSAVPASAEAWTQQLQALADPLRDRTTSYRYDAAGRQRFMIDAEGFITEQQFDAMGRVVRTLRHTEAFPPEYTALMDYWAFVQGGVVDWRSDFEADADDLQGPAHVAVPGGIKLVNRPEAQGGWATSRYNLWGGTTFTAGATVRFELTPQGLQAGLHAGIDTPAGSGTAAYGGLWAVLQSNGHVMAKVQSGATVQWVDLGSYQPGVTLQVEISTSRAGAVLYVYPKGSDRASGLIHRSALSLAAFTPVFVTNRQATQSSETSTLLDNIEVSWGSEVTSHRYDAAGRLTDTVDAEGVLTRRSHDALGRETRRTVAVGLPEASSTAWTYDAAGRQLTETVADGTAVAATTRYRHDALGRVIELVDASAYTTRFEYDAAGRRTAVVDALGGRSTTRYDALGHPVVQVDARGFASYSVYDLAGRRVQQIDAEGGLSVFTHDAFGNVLVTQQYAGRVVRPEQGRVSVLFAGAVPPAQGAYLLADPVLTRFTVNDFSLLNQLSYSEDAEGHAESSVFNAFGQANASTNRVGGTASYQYNRLGQLIQETLPVLGRRADGTMVPVLIQHQYDHRGNRIQTTEAAGLPEQRSTQYRFDAMGRLLQTQGMAYTAVDAAGIASSVLPVDQIRYDALGRTIEQVQSGNLVGASVVGGRRSLAWYDAAGRKTAELSADAVLAEFGHDPAGRVTSQTVRATRLAAVPAAGGNPPNLAPSTDDRTLRHSYDALGRKTQTRLDGVWSWQDGQLVTLPGAQTLTLEQLRYDAAGNLIQHTDARGNHSFSYYDGLNRKRLAIDTGGYAIAWDYALPGSTATRETRYARRVPLPAYDAGTDPQAVLNLISAALAALGADPNERDRVTVLLLDRLGRVTEKQVLQVAFSSVNEAGVIDTGTTSAITAYRYDGLGHVTQIRERIGTDLWQATDIGYDALGRETQRLAPGFVDHQNQSVRPTTHTEYDGLGRTSRFIRRGKDNGSEADDRITRYTYGAHGLLTELQDAEGGLTRNNHDALGNVSRQTRVGVLRSDGSRRDIVKTWQYDAAGRVTVETDLGTGEARQTAYTAFGEVSAKGLNGAWQEFAEYTTRGLVWKTNSGDGAVKIYLHDNNGNTTREIRAGVGSNGPDLRGLTLAQASADADAKLLHSVSVYDARNLLVKTMEQRIERQGSEITLGQQFTEKWLPRPGDLNVNPNPGTSFPQASVQPVAGQSTVTVSEGAQSALGRNVPVVVAGGVDRGTVPVLGGALSAGAVMSFGSFVVKWGIVNSKTPSQVGTTLTLPASPVVGRYRVRQTPPGGVAVEIRSSAGDGTWAVGAVVPVGTGVGGTYKLDIEWVLPGEALGVPVAQAQFSKMLELSDLPGAHFSVDAPLEPRNRIVLDIKDWKDAQGRIPTRFVAIVDADKPGQSFTAAPAMAPWAAGMFWPASSRLVSFDLTSPLRPPLSAGEHTLTIMALDANGAIVSGRNYKMTGGLNPTLDQASATALHTGTEGTLWAQNIRNASNTLASRQLAWDGSPGIGYTFRWRAVGSTDTWLQRWVSGPQIADGTTYGWPGADGAYECSIVSDLDGSIRQGRYEVSGGAIRVANPLLDTLSFTPEILSIAGPPSPDGRVRMTIWNVVFEVATDASGIARFDLAQVRQRLGYDRWTVTTVQYTCEAYVLRAGGLRDRTHVDTGVLRLGPRLDSGATGVSGSVSVVSDSSVPGAITFYQSIGTVTLMNAQGSLTLKSRQADGSYGNPVTLPLDGSNWRLRKTRNAQQLDELHINLGPWVPANNDGTYGEVEFFYQGDDGQTARGLFVLDYNGLVYPIEVDWGELGVMVEHRNPLPLLPLTVPSAARLSVFKIGPDADHLQTVPAAQITGTGPAFNWNAAGHLGQTLSYAYEAVDSAGKLIGKGSGRFSVASDGSITHWPNPPALMPAVLSLTPPPGTAGLSLEVRPAGTSAPFTKLAAQAVSGGVHTYDVDAWVPRQGSQELEFRFVATAADGAVLSVGSGRLRVDASGSTSGGILQERRPVYVHFRLTGRQVAQASLALTDRPDVAAAVLQGTWVPAEQSDDGRGYTHFTWDAGAYGGSGAQLDYSLTALSADGQALEDEIGRPLVQKGRVVLDPNGAKPVELQVLGRVFNTDPKIVITRYQAHNAFGDVIEERDERVADRMQAMLGLTRELTLEEESRARTTLRYNTLGQLIAKIDPETHVTLANGHRYRDRPTTTYGYDLLGRATTSTDANGNLTRQTLLTGSTAVATEWHADGGVRRSAYDLFGDVRQITDEGGNLIQQTYDKLGRLTRVDRLGVTQVNSSGQAQPAITLTDSFSHDALGQRLSHTNALGHTTRMDYDSLGRVVSTRTALGLETRYQYQTEAVTGLNGSIATGTRKTSFHPDGRSTMDKIDYFGHITWHSDLSGTAFTYQYDAAARLVSQTSSVHGGQSGGQSVGQNIRYTYYANGYIKSATDQSNGTLSEYGYDSAGNRVTEGYYHWNGSLADAPYQNATITYDELNRMARIHDSNYFDMRYEYDAVGNRRMVDSIYWDGAAGLRDRQTYWYAYDVMNRFTVTKGSLSGSRATNRADTSVQVVAGTEGTTLGYDLLGRRRVAEYKYDNQTVNESYGYRQDGFLQTTHQGGILKTVRVLDKIGRTVEQTDTQNNSSTVSQYDADNRLLSQAYTDGKDRNKNNTTTYAYYNDTTDTASSASGAGALAKTVTTQQGTTITTTYQYDYWDAAQQKTITKTDATTGTTTLSYNANGHLTRAYDSGARLTTNYFNSANGLILKRERQQGASRVGSHFYYYADGKRVGDVSDDPNDDTRMSYAEALARKPLPPQDKKTLYMTFKPVTSADFDQNYEPINDSYPGPTGSSYTARGGESLAAVAQALWGDGSLWYFIAEANGLNGTQPLVEGQVLVISNKVTNIHNNSSTVRPYSAGEAIGHIDPTLPAPPPPPRKDDCGAMKMVLVIVVTVAVTVATGGAAAGALGPMLGPVLAGVAGGALGGAAGSLAGQGLSIAMGMQDGLDWKALRQSTVAGAVSGGVDAAMGEVLRGSSTAQAWLGGSQALPTTGRSFLSSSATLALQNQWNWRDVMASSVGAGVGAYAGGKLAELGLQTPWSGALVSGAVQQGMAEDGKGRYRYTSLFASTLGSALGQDWESETVPEPAAVAELPAEEPVRAATPTDPDDADARRRDFERYLAQVQGQDPDGAGMSVADGNAWRPWPADPPSGGRVGGRMGGRVAPPSGSDGLFAMGGSWMERELPSMIGDGLAPEPESPLRLRSNERYRGAILKFAQAHDLAPETLAALISAEAVKLKGQRLLDVRDELVAGSEDFIGPLNKRQRIEWNEMKNELAGQWDPLSANPDTTARGLTQFTEKTWIGVAREKGGYLNEQARARGLIDAKNKVVDRAGLLQLRDDPELSIAAAAAYASNNLKALRAAEVGVAAVLTADQEARLVYLAHHEGAGGAEQFLRGELSNERAMDLLTKNVPDTTRRQTLLDAHAGHAARAYKVWLEGYIDQKIRPEKFR